MKYAVVPKAFVQGDKEGTDSIVVWVAALSQHPTTLPAAAILRLGPSTGTVQWSHHFNHRVYFEEVTLPCPQETSVIQLLAGEIEVASARVGAPPRQLPSAGQKPYRVLVGSCYCVANDKGARLAKIAQLLLDQDQSPDVKFLCGDQVYLDTPPNYTWTEHPREEMIEKFLANYLTTWSEQGLLPLLRQGAAYFTSDDHEFWNEYPAGRGKGGRTADYESLSRELFEVFQRRNEPCPFSAGTVSFFALDTRFDRDEEKKNFCKPERLAEVETWLARLNGPGVLVVGEAFFGEEKSVGVSLTKIVGDLIHQPTIDGTLVEHEQYQQLADMLAKSGKTVILISGDVHWGRIAECTLPNGARLIEIIASPFTLVDSGMSRLGRPWTKAPTPFRAYGMSADVSTMRDASGDYYKAEYDHFCTLEFSRTADERGVVMAVRHWNIEDQKNTGNIVYRTVL